MGWRAVEVEIILFDVLAVIGLAVGQAVYPLFEYRVLAIPQGKGEAQSLLVVAETGEAVLTPVIGARAGLIVGEVVPRIAILAVVLTDGTPLAFTEVRPPLPPGDRFLPRFVQTQLFRRLCRFGRRA